MGQVRGRYRRGQGGPEGERDRRPARPFHDHLDRAASKLADLHSLNGNLPLLSLKEAATRSGSDDLSHRIPVIGDDELAQLASAFNAMASSLQGSRADLRESEQRFRALVHHASDVFTVIGADAVIRYQSPAIEQVLGHPAEGIIGRSFLDLVDPDDQEIARQLLERSQMQPGAPTVGEVRMRPREDAQAPRHFEMTATDLLDDATVGGLVLNYRDVKGSPCATGPRRCCGTPMPPCTRPRPAAGPVTRCSTPRCTPGPSPGWPSRPTCAEPSTTTSLSSTTSSSCGWAVVYAIVSLATALGVRVTGEGIETASQLSTLIELDCSHGQGFLLGRPTPPDELAAMLQTVSPTDVTVAARLTRLQ